MGVKRLSKEEKAPSSCVLRLFGAPVLSVQQAAAALPEKWQVTAQCRSRGAETLVALRGRTVEGLRKSEQSLRACFAADLYGEGEQGLAEAAVQALESHRKLLVCSDAAAGALLEARLETVPGAEKVFDFGSMSYADAKAAAQIAQKAGRRAAQTGPAQALARVQAAQRLVGAEFAAGCMEQPNSCVLLLGSKKGCWVRTVPQEENPALWLLDMVRRAACGLPQAAGTSWQDYRAPVPETALTPSDVAAEPPAAPPRKRHWVRNLLLAVLVLALAALAAGWYYTGGDLAALPQKLQSLGAESMPHSGAKLL